MTSGARVADHAAGSFDHDFFVAVGMKRQQTNVVPFQCTIMLLAVETPRVCDGLDDLSHTVSFDDERAQAQPTWLSSSHLQSRDDLCEVTILISQPHVVDT